MYERSYRCITRELGRSGSHSRQRLQQLTPPSPVITETDDDFASASKVGRFMSAVSHFLRTNNPAGLREFEGASVTDVSRKTHTFETRPNALYRLASAHDQSFEHVYRIVV